MLYLDYFYSELLGSVFKSPKWHGFSSGLKKVSHMVVCWPKTTHLLYFDVEGPCTCKYEHIYPLADNEQLVVDGSIEGRKASHYLRQSMTFKWIQGVLGSIFKRKCHFFLAPAPQALEKVFLWACCCLVSFVLILSVEQENRLFFLGCILNFFYNNRRIFIVVMIIMKLL